MAKITRIKASDPGKPKDKSPKKVEKASKKAVKAPETTTKVKVVSDAPKTEKPAKQASGVAKKAKSDKKSEKKPFILIRPIVYLGRYIRDSWREIRQVRWPSRKATWKLVLAIFVYTGIFIAIIMLLDALFTWVFGMLVK